MAKIDVSKIEGYEGMTPEEKVAALEAFESPDPDYSGFVRKDVADKYASEAAKYKKELREKMGAEEAAKIQQEEDRKALLEEINALKRERGIDKSVAKLVEMGYPTDMATASATAIADGDLETLFANQAKFHSMLEKKIRAEVLKETPSPAPGQGKTEINKTEFKKMTLVEKQKFAQENPEQYRNIYGG